MFRFNSGQQHHNQLVLFFYLFFFSFWLTDSKFTLLASFYFFFLFFFFSFSQLTHPHRVYDTPGAIQTQLTEWFGGPYYYSNQKNALLYSIYGLPNMILPLFGGVLMDRWLGVRWGAILMAFLIFLGQTVFALGILGTAYPWCVVGRFIFGLGGESLTVAQNTFTTRWFDGAQLALVFGLVLAFSRIGSAVNFVVTPALTGIGGPYDDIGVPFAVWFGTLLCLMSFGFAVGCSLLDYFGQHRIKRQADAEEPPVDLSDIKNLPLPAWILMIICGFFYVAVLTFYTVASKILQNSGVKTYPPNVASAFIAIPNLVSIVGAPFFGKVLDKFGRALIMLICASLGLMLGHLMMLGNALEWWGSSGQISPIAIFIVIGISYSAGASSIWPVLSYVIPDKTISTGYGMMTSVQNTFLTIFPLITSKILDSHIKPEDQYALTITIFVLCALTSAILSFVLIGLDLKYTNGKLNMSAAERERLRNEAKEEKEPSKIPAIAAGAAPFLAFSEDAQIERPVLVAKNVQQVRRGYLDRLGFQNPQLASPRRYDA